VSSGERKWNKVSVKITKVIGHSALEKNSEYAGKSNQRRSESCKKRKV
jgi:hypothetical protein